MHPSDEDSEMAHVSAFPCPLCQKGTRDLGPHAEGCPNGPDVKIGCMGCGEYIPLREMAAHVMEAHDIDLGQDEIEQSFVQIRERLGQLLAQHFQRLELLLQEGVTVESEENQ